MLRTQAGIGKASIYLSVELVDDDGLALQHHDWDRGYMGPGLMGRGAMVGSGSLHSRRRCDVCPYPPAWLAPRRVPLRLSSAPRVEHPQRVVRYFDKEGTNPTGGTQRHVYRQIELWHRLPRSGDLTHHNPGRVALMSISFGMHEFPKPSAESPVRRAQ